MIDRLQINDFQAHTELRIQLDPCVTVIIGQNDVGKSSVLRALRWLATNRPLGDSFIREGSTQTEVKVRVDGKTIRRRKGRINQYDFDGQAYKAFGSTVPDQIVAHLNLGTVNLQGQHDPPYLLSLSPGEAAKALNEIVDLSMIDVLNRALAKETKTARIEVDLLTKQTEAADQELALFDHVDSLRQEYDQLAALQQDATAAADVVGQLSTLLDQRDVHEQASTQLRRFVDDAQGLLNQYIVFCSLREDIEELAELIEKRSRIEQLAESSAGLARLATLADEVAAARSDHICLEVYLNDRIGYEEGRATLLSEITDLERRLGEACPLCGNPLRSSVPMSI